MMCSLVGESGSVGVPLNWTVVSDVAPSVNFPLPGIDLEYLADVISPGCNGISKNPSVNVSPIPQI